jgi:hypothetical protein
VTGTASSTPTPPPAAAGDLVAAAVADALSCADLVATNMAKVFGGTYSSADAAAATAACTANAAAWTGRLAIAAWQLPFSLLAPPPLVPQPSSRVPGEITVPRSIPLTLHTVGCRAIGYGAQYFIHADRIAFEPATVDPSAGPAFVMVVDWHSLPKAARDITIVYEGEVISVQQGTTVCAPIRFVKPAFAS